MTAPRSPALAIAPENDTAHIGEVATLLSHVQHEKPSQPGKRVVEWEFYDLGGRPLHVADDGAGGTQLVVTDPDADPPSRATQQVLVDRISLALANAQLRLDAVYVDEPAGPDDKTEVVSVQGELDDVLRMLDALEELSAEPDANPHSGSFLHNLLDAVFGR